MSPQQDELYIAYISSSNRFILCFNEESIVLPSFWDDLDEHCQSYLAYLWAVMAESHHEIMMNKMTDPEYRKWWMSYFGNKYKIPDSWLIEMAINNV